MKRLNIAFVLIVGGFLAWIFFQMRAPSNPASDVGEVSPEAQETPKPEEAPVTVPPEEPKVTAEAAAPDAPAQIKENLASARKVLQQKEAIEKAKPEEVHHMPRATLDAAKRLGEIAELEAQHPEQAESFREFYLECARDDKTITVTRAQCADRYIKASKLDAAARKQFLSEFPREVVRLVDALQE